MDIFLGCIAGLGVGSLVFGLFDRPQKKPPDQKSVDKPSDTDRK